MCEAAFGLVAVTLFPGADFQVKGGKGRIRSWAVGQASILKGLIAWILRQELRSSHAARSPRVMVLKKIIQLKRRVRDAEQELRTEFPLQAVYFIQLGIQVCVCA